MWLEFSREREQDSPFFRTRNRYKWVSSGQVKGNTDWWGFGLPGYQKELNSKCSKYHPGKIKYMYSSNKACRRPVCITCKYTFLKACEVLSLTACLTFSPDSSLKCYYYRKRFITQLRPPGFGGQTFKHIPVYIF